MLIRLFTLNLQARPYLIVSIFSNKYRTLLLLPFYLFSHVAGHIARSNACLSNFGVDTIYWLTNGYKGYNKLRHVVFILYLVWSYYSFYGLHRFDYACDNKAPLFSTTPWVCLSTQSCTPMHIYVTIVWWPL